MASMSTAIETFLREIAEIRATGAGGPETIDSEQVGRYWNRYGLVLVTNLRAFAIVGRNAAGLPAVLECSTLARSEPAFWALAWIV